MSVMGIISWCVFGLIVGALARLLLPGSQNISIVLTIILGVIGSFVGGAISSLIFGASENFVNPAGWIMSIVGAVIVLFAYVKLASK